MFQRTQAYCLNVQINCLRLIAHSNRLQHRAVYCLRQHGVYCISRNAYFSSQKPSSWIKKGDKKGGRSGIDRGQVKNGKEKNEKVNPHCKMMLTPWIMELYSAAVFALLTTYISGDKAAVLAMLTHHNAVLS